VALSGLLLQGREIPATLRTQLFLMTERTFYYLSNTLEEIYSFSHSKKTLMNPDQVVQITSSNFHPLSQSSIPKKTTPPRKPKSNKKNTKNPPKKQPKRRENSPYSP